MYHPQYNWAEEKKPIGVIGCLCWLAGLAIWALIFFAFTSGWITP